MQIHVPNAMTVNSIGRPDGTTAPFPACQQVERHRGGLLRIHVYPLQLRDAVDLLVPHMLPVTMLAGVDTYDFDEGQARPLRQTLEDLGATVLADDADAHLIRTAELLTVFGDLQTYNLTALDLAAAPPELSDTWTALWAGPPPVLPRVPGSSLVLSSHDDMYLSVESSLEQLVVELGQRLLTMFVGTQVLRRTAAPATEITDVPVDVVADLLDEADGWSCSSTAVRQEGDALLVGIARAAQDAFDPPAPPADTLSYDTVTGLWQLLA